MSYIENLKEKYISAQWGLFLESAVVNLDLAREIYQKNKNNEKFKNGRRKSIAIRENIPASISIVLFTSSLEGIANAHAFYKQNKNFNQFDDLVDRLSLVLNLSGNLKNAIKELSITRDGIIHGYIWIKSRRYKSDYSIRFVKSYLWKPFKLNLRSKFKTFVDWKNRTTKHFKFSVIPTDINFVDALLGLTITKKVLDLLGWGNKYPRIYNLKEMGFSKETTKIPLSDNFCTLDDWINYFAKYLEHRYDKSIFEYLQQSL